MEGSAVSATGNAFHSPAIYDDWFILGFAQLAGAVHAKGGRIFAQLEHAGRAWPVDLQPNGEGPVAPSALPFSGQAYLLHGQVPATPARALTLEELPQVVATQSACSFEPRVCVPHAAKAASKRHRMLVRNEN